MTSVLEVCLRLVERWIFHRTTPARLVAVALGLTLGATCPSNAEDAHLLPYLDPGLNRDPFLTPGKLDFIYHYLSPTHENQYNALLWTPVFKGGGGILSPEGKPDTTYFGGFARVLATRPDLGDWIIGAHAVESSSRTDHEFQSEYRLPIGLGFGGGIVASSDPASSVQFGKLGLRQTNGSLTYIVETQAQSTSGHLAPGGYVALYNPVLLTAAGTDGEQWRAMAGVVAPESWHVLRPAAEAFYTDNSIGHFDGTRSLLLNLTLGYHGGYLSHPVRLGRAMGPQGLEFGNPLGFLRPTWNRRPEVWEMGGRFDLRAERIELPNRQLQERYDALIFPLQWYPTHSILDDLFIGSGYQSNPTLRTSSVYGGVHTTISFFRLSVAVEHQFENDAFLFTVGVITIL